MKPTLATDRLTLAYGSSPIINNLNLTIPKGKVTTLVGANGCGKSTLLRSLARLLKPRNGVILLNGKDITQQSTRKTACEMAILPQGPVAPEGLTVHQLTKQGRYPYQSWLSQWSAEDEEKVAWALEVTGMLPLKDRPVDSLSGGQRQRAWIAMTLAQDTDTLLLDEPTTYLDLTHQIEVLDLLYDLNEREGRTIVMVLHDLNLAARYAHEMIAICQGNVYSQGYPENIVTEELVREVFQLDCQVISDPVFGTPMCIPHGKGRILQHRKLTAIGG
ncbi:iron complex transport system ATP-binding protein [Marininema mesophilum]|uniref:Iron complex transport system ATP-binding protein n=1 Tax=Marininema mesophilum TaxID=1048340 RepID=A0A1H2WE19_9BACL|nr:ABC transporter ATP-binding protein [Marininema mesophilum]SDW78892.1 iron complex transport system ATP-binding protein [Marininema mesophilum]